MRRALPAALTALLLASCQQGSSSVALHSPSPTASESPKQCAPASVYGLLVASGNVELVSPAGCVAARAPLAPPSVESCATALPAVLPPPVSASNTKVYFRHGDTKIRSLTTDGQTADVTTVPGGPTTVSFFSVSPDDQRIAVIVEDLSAASSVALRLYVEDLVGGGNHSDIYKTSIAKGLGGLTLWPMGWHQGSIVLALVPACSVSAVSSPSEWHVVNASTAARQATIPGTKIRCNAGFWPSPAGVACSVDNTVFVMDWSGKSTFIDSRRPFPPSMAELSPAGRSVATPYGTLGSPGGYTEAYNLGETDRITIPARLACLWISDDSMLAPDAVIAYPSGVATQLPAAGACAGRFPGGL